MTTDIDRKRLKNFLVIVEGTVDEGINPLGEPCTYMQAAAYVRKAYSNALYPVRIAEIVSETIRKSDENT